MLRRNTTGLTEAADEYPVLAVTRMRFKRVWALVPALMRFRRLYAEARTTPGFIRGHASVVNPWTVVNLSIWSSRRAMLQWSGRDMHVHAVRWTYTRVAEVWSADWRLNEVSQSASTWSENLLLSSRTSGSTEGK